MGRKSAGATLAEIVFAFLLEPTWSQAALARRCDVERRTIRLRMRELEEAGFRFDREEDRDVYWTRLPDWIPGAAGRAVVDATAVARLVGRLPKSAARERVLGEIVHRVLGGTARTNEAEAEVADDVLTIIEDAARARTTMPMAYYSAGRNERINRHASVQRIVYGDHIRFVARCHRDGALKWFRADRVGRPMLDPSVAFVEASTEAVDRFIGESADGFHGSGDAQVCRFFVRMPEAGWAVRNLPRGLMTASVTLDIGGARVEARTTALDVVARFLVGLGGAVDEIEPRGLRARVQLLAREALEANEGARVNARARRATVDAANHARPPEARPNRGVVRAIQRGARDPDRITRGE